MLSRAYKKIIEDNQRVMKEQRERIDVLKEENARILAELENLKNQSVNRDAYDDLAPVETYINEVERLASQKLKEENVTRRRVYYMQEEELEKLLSDLE